MNRLIAVALAFLPTVALAQPAPPQFCIPPSLAQTLAAALQQDAAVLAMLNDAAHESQRQAKAIAGAVARQKAEDEAAAKTATPPAKP